MSIWGVIVKESKRNRRKKVFFSLKAIQRVFESLWNLSSIFSSRTFDWELLCPLSKTFYLTSHLILGKQALAEITGPSGRTFCLPTLVLDAEEGKKEDQTMAAGGRAPWQAEGRGRGKDLNMVCSNDWRNGSLQMLATLDSSPTLSPVAVVWNGKPPQRAPGCLVCDYTVLCHSGSTLGDT